MSALSMGGRRSVVSVGAAVAVVCALTFAMPAFGGPSPIKAVNKALKQSKAAKKTAKAANKRSKKALKVALAAGAATGAAGVSGGTGTQGLAGAPGAAGAVGPAGPKGATGPMGPQGPKGDTGATGPRGLAGASIRARATSTQATLTNANGSFANVPLSDNTFSMNANEADLIMPSVTVTPPASCSAANPGLQVDVVVGDKTVGGGFLDYVDGASRSVNFPVSFIYEPGAQDVNKVLTVRVKDTCGAGERYTVDSARVVVGAFR